jgi:hypothetical protein
VVLAEVRADDGAHFKVRLTASTPVTITTNAPGYESVSIEGGKAREIAMAGEGPIGRQFDFKADDGAGHEYALHLFDYDPVERSLVLMQEMIERFAAKGLNVDTERGQLAELRQRQAADHSSIRDLFADARLAKRHLMLRDPDLKVIDKILYEHELFRNDRFLLQLSVGTMPHADMMRAIELYGTVVAPAVRLATSNSIPTDVRGAV